MNAAVLDFFIKEGYADAAANFARETNLNTHIDLAEIRDRVNVRNAIHSGQIREAITMIHEINSEILDQDHHLHFKLLQLQLIEIVRPIIKKPTAEIQAAEFQPAIKFATEQLAPRAPTDPKYQRDLQLAMALMIYPREKMMPELKELLDLKLRETTADAVNVAMLEKIGVRPEAKLSQLIRARAWAEAQARQAGVVLPETIPIGLDAGNEVSPGMGHDDVMET